MVTEQRELSGQIAEALRRARRLAGMSQAEVAVQLGVAQTTLCGWEAGERMPRAPELALMAEVYGCTTDFLLGRSEHPTGLPVAELLVDQDVVDRILRARSTEELEDLVDWEPQLISFWQIVKASTRVRTRQQVQALTVELANHVQRVAPELWRLYAQGARELKKRQRRWESKRTSTGVTRS